MVDVPAPVFATLLLCNGLVLHPILKLFYKEGYGDTKNTVSVLDAGAAFLCLVLLRLVCPTEAANTSESEARAKYRRRLLVLTILPGLSIFGSIALATLANYQSLFLFFVSAPLDFALLLVILHFMKAWTGERKWAELGLGERSETSDTEPLDRSSDPHANSSVFNPWRVVGVVAVLIGVGLLAAAQVLSFRVHQEFKPPADGWTVAIASAVAFRLNQAVGTIVIRAAAVKADKLYRDIHVLEPRLRARKSSRKPLALVLDLAVGKMFWVFVACIPYAIWMEGFEQPWKELGSVLLGHGGSRARWLLLLTMVITCLFQTANVGLNASLACVSASAIGQLQPVTQVVAAIGLGAILPAFSKQLGLHFSFSDVGAGWNLMGCSLLLSGAVLLRFGLCTSRHQLPPPQLRHDALEANRASQ